LKNFQLSNITEWMDTAPPATNWNIVETPRSSGQIRDTTNKELLKKVEYKSTTGNIQSDQYIATTQRKQTE